jgi:hypothetical protein
MPFSNELSLKDLLEMLPKAPRRVSPNGAALLRIARALDEQGMTKEADRITQAMVRAAQPGYVSEEDFREQQPIRLQKQLQDLSAQQDLQTKQNQHQKSQDDWRKAYQKGVTDYNLALQSGDQASAARIKNEQRQRLTQLDRESYEMVAQQYQETKPKYYEPKPTSAPGTPPARTAPTPATTTVNQWGGTASPSSRPPAKPNRAYMPPALTPALTPTSKSRLRPMRRMAALSDVYEEKEQQQIWTQQNALFKAYQGAVDTVNRAKQSGDWKTVEKVQAQAAKLIPQMRPETYQNLQYHYQVATQMPGGESGSGQWQIGQQQDQRLATDPYMSAVREATELRLNKGQNSPEYQQAYDKVSGIWEGLDDDQQGQYQKAEQQGLFNTKSTFTTPQQAAAAKQQAATEQEASRTKIAPAQPDPWESVSGNNNVVPSGGWPTPTPPTPTPPSTGVTSMGKMPTQPSLAQGLAQSAKGMMPNLPNLQNLSPKTAPPTTTQVAHNPVTAPQVPAAAQPIAPAQGTPAPTYQAPAAPAATPKTQAGRSPLTGQPV